MFVTRTVQYEITDNLGADMIANIIDGDDYYIAEDEYRNEITYYDLDAKNQVIFLEELQKQLDTEIAERIDFLKKNYLEKDAAATN